MTSIKVYLIRWRWIPRAFLLTAILSLGFPLASRGQDAMIFAHAIGPTAELCLRVLAETYGHIGIAIRDKGLPAERSLVESNKGTSFGDLPSISLPAQKARAIDS